MAPQTEQRDQRRGERDRGRDQERELEAADLCGDRG
jgi:hypothetical protein